MLEYKIIGGSMIECQKWLNQWRHEYKLDICQMSLLEDHGDPYVVILLTRTRKGG